MCLFLLGQTGTFPFLSSKFFDKFLSIKMKGNDYCVIILLTFRFL